jgi:hypothetical protein
MPVMKDLLELKSHYRILRVTTLTFRFLISISMLLTFLSGGPSLWLIPGVIFIIIGLCFELAAKRTKKDIEIIVLQEGGKMVTGSEITSDGGRGKFLDAIGFKDVNYILPMKTDLKNYDKQSELQNPVIKFCPMCAEGVRPEAKICRFCRHDFT